MQNENELWDDRLDGHGIDAVSWSGRNEGEPRKLKFVFKERINGRRIEIDTPLIPNENKSEYSSLAVSEELEARGIEDAWVIITTDPYHRSAIHIKLKDLTEPIKIIKRYN